jgi:hypothetical protein
MLAVIAAILSALGVLLNWPRFPGGIFHLSAVDLSPADIFFGPGFESGMGKLVLAVAIFIGFTFFPRPSFLLLRIRSLLLGAAAALLSLAIVQAARISCPFHFCTGLVFSAILMLTAFLAAVMRIGVVAPASGGSQPLSAGEDSLLLKSIFPIGLPRSQSKKLYVTSLDNLDERWPQEVTKAFAKSEITIGRDGEWADVQVGGIWGAVSNRHGKVRVIGNSVFFEPLAVHYAFAVDDIPCQAAKEIRQGSVLSLVSGLGPRLQLELKAGGENGDFIPEVERKSEIMEDNERKLRFTLRIMLGMVLLSLALFGAFLAAQRSLSLGKTLPGASRPETIRQGTAAAPPIGA